MTTRRLRQRRQPDRLTQAAPRQAPFTPSGPSPQATPFDAAYDQQVGFNQNVLNQALAAIAQQRGEVGYNYGFNAQGQLDPTNPFSKAKELERQFQQGQRATTGSLASQGQLYSGYHQSKLDEGTHRYGASFDALRQAAMGQFNRLSEAEQQARLGQGQGNIDAYSDRMDRLADYRPADPGPPLPLLGGPPQPSPFQQVRRPPRAGRRAQRMVRRGQYGSFA